MATAAAAIIAKARRRIASHFMAQNAVSAKDAVEFTPARLAQRRQFERMRDAGVVVNAGGGRYWLDVRAYDEWQNARRKRVGIMVGAGIAAAAIAALFAG